MDDRLYKELGELFGNYDKARLIEQNIPSEKLKYMNLDALVYVVNSDINIVDINDKRKLTMLSYEDVITSTQRELTVSHSYIQQLYNITENVELVGAMLRLSSRMITYILEDLHLPPTVAVNMSYSNLVNFDIPIETVRLTQMQFTSLIDNILSNGYVIADISKDTLILSEIRSITNKGIETRYVPCLVGLPVQISNDNRQSADLYMKFMLYALLGIYEDRVGTFINNIEDIERIANGPCKARLSELIGNKVFDADDIFNFFTVPDRILQKSSSSTQRALSTTEIDMFDDPIRLNDGTFISKHVTEFKINVNIEPGTYAISQAVNDPTSESIWIYLDLEYNEIAENLSEVQVTKNGAIVSIFTQHPSIGVFTNSDSTNVNIDGSVIKIDPGTIIALSSGNHVIIPEDGQLLWFI